ncbi:MAG: ATP phosphoribosyltransferase regulatory subunit, partial [Methylococcaceae bacterium]|nr:ATP phosphoribosyltransferase regulatory subunit [Methylococcaceae bacterium]
MLSEDRWLLPEGIEEVLPRETKRLEGLRRKVLDLFASWGYLQVITPLIEYIESLLIGAGHDLDLQTFKLIDQISGRQMGVRADMTPQVARIDARHGTDDIPSRFCYLGTVLHTQADHLQRSRSPLQVGAELYGHSGCASDLEVIRLMLEMLSLAGLQNIHLDLGHVGIYRTLVGQAGLNGQQEAELFDILQRKAAPDLREFFAANPMKPAVANMLAALIELHGGESVIGQARERLNAADGQVKQALSELETIAARLARDFPQMPIHFDLAELRGYHYHRGVVFAAFIEGYGRELARGGRYDGIGKSFGRSRPATGFSADLKVITRLTKATP